MIVVGWTKHFLPAVRGGLLSLGNAIAFRDVCQEATWHTFQDLQKRFPNARPQGDDSHVIVPYRPKVSPYLVVTYGTSGVVTIIKI